MLSKTWLGFLALVCGFSVTWLMGGHRPPLAWLVVPLAVLVLFTIVVRAARGRFEGPRAFNESPVPATRDAISVSETDRSVVAEVLNVVRVDHVNALRKQDFSHPWLSRYIDPFEALLHLGKPSPADVALDDALENLFERTASFLDFYRRTTVVDPLISSGEWTNLVRDPITASLTADEPETRPEQLRQGASEIAAAYEHLVTVASSLAGPARRQPAPSGAAAPREIPRAGAARRRFS